MTTMSQARAAMVSEVEARVGGVFPTLARVYGNTPVDRTAVKEFLKVDIRFVNGSQINLGPAGGQRKFGSLIFRMAVLEDAGDVRAMQVLDLLDTSFRTRYVGPVLLKSPRPNGSVTQQGWCFHEIFVPFQFDDFST